MAQPFRDIIKLSTWAAGKLWIKKSESLKKFSGEAGDFANWSKRFIDHMSRVHDDWSYSLDYFSKTNEDLSFARLNQEVMGPFSENAKNLVRKLEQTIIDYMPTEIYHRRQQFCGGISEKRQWFQNVESLASGNGR